MSQTNAVAPAAAIAPSGHYPALIEACREVADGLEFTLRASPFSVNEPTVQYATGRVSRRGNNLNALIIAAGIPFDDPAPELLIGAVVFVVVRHAKDGHGDARAAVTGLGTSDLNREWLEQFKAPPKTDDEIARDHELLLEQMHQARISREAAALQAAAAAHEQLQAMRAACVPATPPEPALTARGVTWHA